MRRKNIIVPKREEKQLKVFDYAVILTKIIAFVLAITFTWLELHDVPKDLFTDDFSSLFFKIIIALYYIAWARGPIIDLQYQKSVLLIAPNEGKITITAIATIVMLGILFGIFCYVNAIQEFAIAFSVFHIFNIVSWFIFKSKMHKPVKETIKMYKAGNDYYNFLKIQNIEDFLWGDWQKKRFLIGSFLIVIVNILAFSELPQVIASKLKLPSSQFIIVLSIFSYIVFMEIWIWHLRIKRSIVFELIKEIESDNWSKN